MTLKNRYLILALALIISSCSSIADMQFWKSDDVEDDPTKPAELKEFKNEVDINIAWVSKFKNEDNIGDFKPAFSSGKIFFSDSSGKISSLNNNGSSEWDVKLNNLSSGTAAGFGVVVVADIDGNIICLNQQNGDVNWTINVKNEVLAPAAISARYVIVKTSAGELVGLNKTTGELIWSYRSQNPTLTVRGSSEPVIYEDQVFATFDNGRLGVFQLDTGFTLWDGAISYTEGTTELENLIDADSPPVVDGRLVYANNYQGNINIFDIAQKRSVWTAESSSFYSPLIIRGMMVLIQDDSSIKSFSTNTLLASWSSNEYKNRNLSNGVNFKGNIIFGDDQGYVHALDPLSGKTIGRKKISRHPIAKIVSRSDGFYVVDENLQLFSLSI